MEANEMCWRLQGPRAMFTEIEQELDARLSPQQTRTLQNLALTDAATDVGT